MRKYVIGGNWKLQINSIQQTKEIIVKMASVIDTLISSSNHQVKVFLALPYISLETAINSLDHNSFLSIAAQNVHYEATGPFTGEVSIIALKELGIEYILVGHSERRIIFKESDEVLRKKTNLIIKHGMCPILCIGETAVQRNANLIEQTITNQLSVALKDISNDEATKIIIAYEPVWAINNKLLNPSGKIIAATPNEAETTHLMIRKWLISRFNKKIAESIPILYGGSMNSQNAEVLLKQMNIDGGLIGGASLKVESFTPIVNLAIKQSNLTD